MKFIKSFLALLLLTASLGFSVESQVQEKSKEELYRDIATQIKLFGEIYRGVNLQYVDPVVPEEFIEAAIKGMLGTLDPYTVYFDNENIEELEIIAEGEYGGVGIEIGLRGEDKALTVISPIDDTPAMRKGLRAGDVIVAVEGESTKGWTTSDAAKHIRGPKGTDVTLTIQRAGFDKPLDYVLTRDAITIHDVTYSGIIEGTKVGYIKLSRFSGHAGSELTDALNELNAQKPVGLILDLRSNPGGLLPAAVEVSQQFLDDGAEIVSTHGRTGRSERDFKASGTALARDIPLIVMINRGSASASEIVAGAIQDHDRGIIIGEASFGKGLVQSVLNLSSGAALKITTARYYTPSGRLIQKPLKKDDKILDIDPEDMTMDDMENEEPESGTPKEIFYTDAGRPVFGGGGITPDIELTLPYLDRAVVEMYRQDFFYEFVKDWTNEHGSPQTFDVSDKMIDNFIAGIKTKDFTPQTAAMRELEALRKIGERDTLQEKYFSLIDEIENLLNDGINLDDPKMRSEIQRSLEIEMASNLEGLQGRIKASLKHDIQLTRAVEILSSPGEYSAIIKGSGRADASPAGKN